MIFECTKPHHFVLHIYHTLGSSVKIQIDFINNGM